MPSVANVNPYAALPRAIAPPTVLVLDMLPPVTPAMPFRLPLRERRLESALANPNVQTNHALVTPAKQDEVNKTRTKIIKQVELATKRKTAVSTSEVTNGSGTLAAELWHENDGVDTPRPINATLVPAAKKKKKTRVATSDEKAAVPVVTGPPVPKCEGCIHCDLLELKVMEPKVIEHYLKLNQFLELAK